MPITQRFNPASVVEVPPEPIPAYDAEGYWNSDRDEFVTFKQGSAIAVAMYHPQLFIVEAKIVNPTGPFPPSARKGENEHDYRGKWSNGFLQTLAAIGRQLDIEEKNRPGEGIKRTLKLIYDEMRATVDPYTREKFNVPWWVYDRVK